MAVRIFGTADESFELPAVALVALDERYAAPMVLRGEWDGNETYAIGDVVTYQGQLWQAYTGPIGPTPPFPVEDFNVLVAQNVTFDADIDDWEAGHGNEVVSWDAAEFHTDSGSLKVVANAAGDAGPWNSVIPNDLTADTAYTLMCWVKTSVTRQVRLDYGWWVHYWVTVTAGVWTQLSLPFVRHGGDAFSPSVILDATTTGDTFWMDELILVEMTPAPFSGLSQWNLVHQIGSIVTDTVTVDTTQYVEVMIGDVLVKLAVCS